MLDANIIIIAYNPGIVQHKGIDLAERMCRLTLAFFVFTVTKQNCIGLQKSKFLSTPNFTANSTGL